MTELEKFQELKEKVLLKYQEHHPFFQGNWKSFSSQDIQNLIELIENNCKQTISEKWIYTHLKPETNSKIPRKDMLNILSEFVGFSGWDEFSFEEKIVSNEIEKSKKPNKSKRLIFAIVIIILIAIVIAYCNQKEDPNSNTIELNNEFTNEKVASEELKVVQVTDSVEKELEVKEGTVEVVASDKKSKLVIKSPFYRTRTVVLNPNENSSKPPKNIDLQPDDYAMMLKAFMLSDIKDWQTRKIQLNKILAENCEVIVMLKDNLGSEYFNKSEFSQKLTIPTANLKKMKIIEIKNDADNKIQFIRIKQE